VTAILLWSMKRQITQVSMELPCYQCIWSESSHISWFHELKKKGVFSWPSAILTPIISMTNSSAVPDMVRDLCLGVTCSSCDHPEQASSSSLSSTAKLVGLRKRVWKWTMNLKGCEGSGHGLHYGNIPEFGVERQCKTGNISMRIAGIRGDNELGTSYIRGMNNTGYSTATMYYCKRCSHIRKENEDSHKLHSAPW
jgi:hypothetical protein